MYTLFDGRDYHQFYGQNVGSIAHEIRGSNGFGFDVIFIPNGYTETFAQMSPEEKNKISRRAKALKNLEEFLSKINQLSRR